MARSQLVNANVTSWCHVISGMVRGPLLLGEGDESPKQWMKNQPLEDSPHTSVHQRVEHCRKQGRLADLQAARQGSVAATKLAAGLDDDHSLCPINDARACGSERVGLLEGSSLGSYLQLVDWTSFVVGFMPLAGGTGQVGAVDQLNTLI